MATLAIRYSQPGTPAFPSSFPTALWLHSSTDTFDEGWKIRYDGWTQGVTQFVAGAWTNVEERVTLKIEGSSPDDLSDKQIALDTVINDIQFHLQSNSNRTYWLFTALDGEAAPAGDESNQAYRISPIIGIASSFTEGLFGIQTSQSNTVLQYTIIIERRPFWEGLNLLSLTPAQYANFNITQDWATVTVGGVFTFSDTVEGTSPARITKLDFKGIPGGGGPFTEVWLGFRSNQLGTPANFVPIWELEDTAAANRGDDTAVASEGSDTSPRGSSTNNKLSCTFGTNANMSSRSILTLADVTTSAQRDDQRGRHVVLLRAKVTSTRTAYVRMDSGYSGATNWRTGTRILIDSTDWFLYQLGYVTIPATRLSELEMFEGGATVFSNFGIKINAQSAGGSGNLDLDCLVLIPQDEGAVYINDAEIEYDSVAGLATVGYDPLDNSYAVSRPATNLLSDKNLEAHFEHLGLPVNSGFSIGIVAAQRSSSQVLADTIGTEFFGRFRWRSLRGTEGWF